MKLVFITFVFLCSNLSFSSVIETKVYELLSPVKNDDAYLILGTDGRVYEISSDKLDIVEQAKMAKELQENIVIKTNTLKSSNSRAKVRSIEVQLYSSFKKNEVNLTETPTPLDNFSVSIITPEDGKSLFNTMNRKTRRWSQCYNRAHVWAYELSKKYIDNKRLNIGKTWIFFTQKYIREYKYKWWFHIAPYTQYKNSNEIFVMDRSFAKKPIALKSWTDIFMKNDAKCKIVKYYSHYRKNQQSESCYIILSSMYYWQPFNIENLEKGEAPKESFKIEELEKAYRNAIKRWNGDIL